MKNIECLIWRTELNNVDERTNDKFSLFQEKACRLIEADINERGGVAGKDLKISFVA